MFVALGRYGFLGGGGFVYSCLLGMGVGFCLSGVAWRWLGCGWPSSGWGVGGVFLSGAVLGTFLVRGRYGNICAC